MIAYGSDDILAGKESTRMAFERSAAEYVVWKRLDGHGHIDLTVGECTAELVAELDRLILESAESTGAVD